MKTATRLSLMVLLTCLLTLTLARPTSAGTIYGTYSGLESFYVEDIVGGNMVFYQAADNFPVIMNVTYDTVMGVIAVDINPQGGISEGYGAEAAPAFDPQSASGTAGYPGDIMNYFLTYSSILPDGMIDTTNGTAAVDITLFTPFFAGNDQGGQQINFYEFDAAVPEPSSIVQALAGILILFAIFAGAAWSNAGIVEGVVGPSVLIARRRPSIGTWEASLATPGGLHLGRRDSVGRYEKGPGGNGIARRAMILAQLALGPLPEPAPVGIDNEGISIRDAGPERAAEGAARTAGAGRDGGVGSTPGRRWLRPRSRGPRPAAAPLPAWSARQAGTGLRWPPRERPGHPSASGPRRRWSRTGKCPCSGGRNRSPHRRAIHSRANAGWRNLESR